MKEILSNTNQLKMILLITKTNNPVQDSNLHVARISLITSAKSIIIIIIIVAHMAVAD